MSSVAAQPGSLPLERGARSGSANPWLVAVTVTLATFMEVLDTSIANVALPHIAGSLSAGLDESTWVLTSYLVSNAIVLPLSAWLSSVFGRKRFYMGCVALFTLSSALCGLAPNLGVLILCRVLQGAGGGGLQPSEQAILADTFTPKQRGMAFAVYGIAVVCAPALGPTLGGWITDNYSWRWIFLINVPVGLLSLTLTHFIVPDPPEQRGRGWRAGGRVDFVGLGLVTVGLGCLQIVLDKGQQEDWFGSPFVVWFAVAAAVGLVGTVAWELTTDNPVIDLRLLKERNFATAFALMSLLGFVLLGSTVLIPQFVQSQLGYTATLGGEALSLGAVFIIGLMPIVGVLLGRVPGRWIVMAGLTLCGLGLWRMTHWDLQVSFRTIAFDRVLQASGIAFLFVPINSVAYAFLPKSKNNSASALMNLARNVGGSIGISFVTTMLVRRAQAHQTYLVGHATPFDPAYRERMAAAARSAAGTAAPGGPAAAAARAVAGVYNEVLAQANMLATLDNFRALMMMCFCAIPLVFLLKPNDPAKAQAGH